MKKLLNSDENRNLNEIVFENRNKMYGAYALRQDESSILKKSMFLGISLFLALAITPVVISGLKTAAPDGPGVTEPPLWVLPPEIEKEKKPDLPKVTPPATQKPVATYNSTVPTPTKRAKEKPGPTVKRDEAVAGFQDTPGEKPVETYTPPIINPGPVTQTPVTQTPVTPVSVKDPNAIEKNVDVQADFTGGIEAFRKKVGQNFNTADYDGSGERISATVTFIVEKDGTISSVKATGTDVSFNREAEKTVKSIKGNWKPAVLDGQKVRSYFKIPISMQFD